MLRGLKITQLKAILTSRGVSAVGLFEKEELINRIVETDDQQSPSATELPPTRPSSRLQQIAGQTVRVVDNRGGEGYRDSLGVLLLHGFGANKEDLVPFAQSVLRRLPDRPVYFYCPDAPVALEQSGGSYGWWPLNLQELMIKVMTSGLDRLFDQEPPPGMDAARQRCQTLLADIRARHSRLAIGGFSQGSMLSTDLCLNSPPDQAPHVLFVLSGACVCPKAWAALAKDFRPQNVEKISVLQTHGSSDQILPFPLGKTLADFFTRSLPHATTHKVRFALIHPFIPPSFLLLPPFVQRLTFPSC